VPGIGLIEPNPPTPGTFGDDPGDNLDAVDFDTTALQVRGGPIYFSLDSQFADPLEVLPGAAPPPNTGTAVANSPSGADVLSSMPGGAPAIYASALSLGLDLLGQDTDDLDALVLAENGTAGFQVSITPFDWLTGGTDMLLFSVRRGSAVIGMLDSILGIGIEEGDVLTAPCAAGSVLPNGIVCTGGGTPGIFMAAEALGLATVRSGTGASYGLPNPSAGLQDIWADDLDALDQITTGNEVTEPGTLALLSAGAIFAGLARRRRKRL
jgi:hypothetical protein